MLTLRSPAFSHGGKIPPLFTCEGKDLSPALEFSGAPAGTRSLALIVHDPDAPDPKAPRTDWVHWLLYNLPADCAGLVQAVAEGALPPGTLPGVTDFRRTIGRHRYFFVLHALDAVLSDLATPARPRLEREIKGHILATAELMGTYQKGD